MLSPDITIGEALWISVIGLILVFVVLCLLIVVFALLSAVAKGKTVSDASVQGESISLTHFAPGSCGDIALFDVPDREAALIMAIVADDLQQPLHSLRFVSIGEILKEVSVAP